MVRPEEMKFLIQSSDKENFGLFKLSYGYRMKQEFVICEGPLKKSNVNIVWVNEKKNKACVEITLFNRRMNVILGINLIKNNI